MGGGNKGKRERGGGGKIHKSQRKTGRVGNPQFTVYPKMGGKMFVELGGEKE